MRVPTMKGMSEPWAAQAERSSRKHRLIVGPPAGEAAVLRELADVVAAGVLVAVDEPRSRASGSPLTSEEETMEQTGMWAPYEPTAIGEPLELLEEAGEFVLVEASVREGVSTQYGPRDAVDLVVGTIEPGVTRLVSGFAAGIVGQAKRKLDGDLPAVVRIVPRQTGRGATRELDPIAEVDGNAAAIAEAARGLPVPLAPLNTAANGEGRPAGDDGIPY
jgi:hypothetical protein